MSGEKDASMKAEKAELRIKLRRLRAKAHQADQENGGRAGECLADFAREHLKSKTFKSVAGYIPMGDEIDPRPLLAHFFPLGAQLSMPVVVSRDAPLVFREWAPGDLVLSGDLHTLQPLTERSETLPDLFIVPLLGFDRRGVRLGQGGGFYDRTLSLARQRGVVVYGAGYDVQEVASLPSAPHDQLLDGVITPTSFMVWDENRTINYLTQK